MIDYHRDLGVDILKKLIFYSDQIIGKSDNLDEELLNLLNKKNPKLAYISSCTDLTRKYYNQKVEYYKRLGIYNLLYFDIDEDFHENKIKELLQCDAIHLSGGNTAYFLSNIKRRNFHKLLKDYVEKGGTLIGISAGSIIMTEAIDIVTIGDTYENFYDLNSSEGLGLVNFEFMPHWNDKIYNIDKYKTYSLTSEKTLYLCSDSDGIVVRDDDIKFIGNILKVENGIVSKL